MGDEPAASGLMAGIGPERAGLQQLAALLQAQGNEAS